MKIQHLTETSKAIIITPEDENEERLVSMLQLFVSDDDGKHRAMLREITTIDNGMLLKVVYEDKKDESS